MSQNAILKIALIQQAAQSTKAANWQQIETAVTAAAQQGAELILLQELHNDFYFPQTESIENFKLAETLPGPTTEFLGNLAKSLKVVIVGSLFEKRLPGLYHNTACVFEKDGTLLGTYRKMHIPDDPGFYEKYYFTPGDQGFHPITTSLGKLGVLVCWDQWFPEAARLMALRGAEILLYPTAIGWDNTEDSLERKRQLSAWMTIQQSHAIANGIPVAACNRVGIEESPQKESSIEFWGNSFVAGCFGEILAKAGTQSETLLCEVDRSQTEKIRQTFPFLRDRRIDRYTALNKILDET